MYKVNKDVVIINGDCMVELDKIKSPKRFILTDIPYGVVSRDSNGLRNLDKDKADIETFDVIAFLEKIFDKAEIFCIFCGNEQYSGIYEWFNEKSKKKLGTTRQIVWAKANPSPMNGQYVYLNGTENAVWFKKRGTGLMNTECKKNYLIHPTGSSKFHPTEKNHKLLQDLILDNTNEGDVVIDPCMGSGSTGIVAMKNNRKFIGIELDEKYFNISKERLIEVDKGE